MRELAVQLEDVAVSFPMARRRGAARYAALSRVNASIRHGDRVGLVGRNGAGKSTLLQVLADVIAPDSGRVQRNHGVCQLLNLNLGFLPYLSGRENAILSGLLQGFSRRQINAELEAIAEFSELGEFFDAPFSTYSSGMRVRLGFAVAMRLEPDVLLLDEVFGVGDAQFQERSRAAIHQRVHSGITVVLVSHQEETLRRFCDRAVWIESGVSRAEGPVEEVLREYREFLRTEAAARAEAQKRVASP